MKKVVLRTLVTLFCLLFLSAGNVWANLITNGSFELGDYSGNNGSWERLAAGDTRLTGWTIGGLGVDWHNTYELHPSYNGNPAERMIDLNLDGGGATGTISQTINTTLNSHYLLTFSMASPFEGVSLNIHGAGVYDYALFCFETGTPLVWENKWIDFYATGSQTIITFSSLNGDSYWGPVLDNIVLEEMNNTVPEPVSLLLLGIGLAGIAGMRRKFVK